MKKTKHMVLGLIVLLLVGCGTTGAHHGTPKPAQQTEFLMGTVVNVKIYDQDKENVLETVFEDIQSLADALTAHERDSVIGEINGSAGIKPVKVSEDVFKLIQVGKKYSELADGSFDITIGPLSNLWRIGFPDARKPHQTEIDDVLPLIDYKAIELNEGEQTVYLTKENMQLDLGAIAKGFITDEIASSLKANGVTTAVIDLGGNIYVLGDSPQSNDHWDVGIQDPFESRGEIVGKIRVKNQSIVTSGVYERNLEVDGEVFHHLLNPETGYPYDNDVAGVTVVTDHSTDADALSTILFGKGIEAGLAYVEATDGVEAIFISHDKEVYTTSGIESHFELTNDQFKMMSH